MTIASRIASRGAFLEVMMMTTTSTMLVTEQAMGALSVLIFVEGWIFMRNTRSVNPGSLFTASELALMSILDILSECIFWSLNRNNKPNRAS